MLHIEWVQWVDKNRGRKPVATPGVREIHMKELYISGKTLQEIGDIYQISRERVRQLLTKFFGFNKLSGGKFIESTARKISDGVSKSRISKEKEERKYQKVFGCTKEKFLEINKEPWNRKLGTPAMAYYSQWHNAVHDRKIEWKISFSDWWEIWQNSGKWELRGRGNGKYCMSRIGDTGPYEVGNVEIKTINENFSESYYKHPATERAKKRTNRRGTKTHCWRGHERNPENTGYISNRPICRLCANIRGKERRDKMLRIVGLPNKEKEKA